jgi:16S rRNA processing protein RimM
MNTLTPVNKPIVIGQISGVFCVHGWVKFFSHTEQRNNILVYTHWLIKKKDGWHSVYFIKGRKQGKTIVAQLNGVDDPDKAHALIGCDIAIDESQLKQLAEDEFYWRELQGLKVVNLEDTVLGNVSSMMATGANDVIVVKLDAIIAKAKNTKEILIPYIDSVVKNIDLDAGLIKVDWDEDFD